MKRNYKLKAFGVTQEILGSRHVQIEMEGKSVAELREFLSEKFPRMKELRSMMIAVNNDYAENDTILNESDEIALIPPVSGG